jgi:UDP-GlcNAc:undecaprenyl-phosphate/decaprenyl-phosphate GlcNAc-1-phosphate transferase
MNFILPSLIWVFAGLLTILLCHNATRIGAAFGLLDIPDDRKIHRNATPLMGGVVLLAIFCPFSFAIVGLMSEPKHQHMLGTWLLAVVGMTLVGIADDRHSLKPSLRLALSFLIFGAAAYYEQSFNVRVLDFEHPRFQIGLGTRGFAIMFTVLCCVGLVNAVNMADGKNGLVVGLCIGWLATLAWRAPSSFLTIIVLLIVILTVLFVYNLKGRLFLGDGGAYGLASLLGMLAIAIYNNPGAHATREVAAEEVMLLCPFWIHLGLHIDACGAANHQWLLIAITYIITYRPHLVGPAGLSSISLFH